MCFGDESARPYRVADRPAEAPRLIAEADSLEELVEIRDRAAAIQYYFKREGERYAELARNAADGLEAEIQGGAKIKGTREP